MPKKKQIDAPRVLIFKVKKGQIYKEKGFSSYPKLGPPWDFQAPPV